MSEKKKGFKPLFDPDTEMTILAFDPAITNMGWAYLHRSKEGIYTLLDCGTIDGRKINKDKAKKKIFKEAGSYTTLLAIEAFSEGLMTEKSPDYVVSESAFAHRFIQAYASLTLVINAIRRASDKARNKDILLIAPMQTKKYMSGKSTADKDLMKEALKAYPFIKGLSPNRDYTEHEIDAISHGIAAIELRLKIA